MPPVVQSVALMLALAGPLCLVAATRASAKEAPFASGPRATIAASASLSEAERELRAQISSRPGRVEPVGFQASSRSSDPGKSRQLDFEKRSPGPPDSGASADASRPAPLEPPGTPPPIPLAPRSRSKEGGAAGEVARAGGLPSVVTIGSSLTLVLGLFLVVAWLMRRAVPGGSALLPGEVLEVLGRAALAGRTQVHLVRLGNKLLLVSISTASVETLAEITDTDEVTRLAGLCRQAQPGSTTAAFRQVLQQLAGQRTASGRTGADDVRLANAGMPGTDDVTWEGRDV
jgi:flagellar biogenesis protein FliO